HNKILWDLHLSRAEIFQQAQDLFKNLEQPRLEASAEVWADHLLTLFELYEQGNLSICILKLLQNNALLQVELHDLISEIYVSLLPSRFEDPADAP
ncbi:hypothetical protein C0995_005679, partial [Termitomyces sp. Mi166